MGFRCFRVSMSGCARCCAGRGYHEMNCVLSHGMSLAAMLLASCGHVLGCCSPCQRTSGPAASSGAANIATTKASQRPMCTAGVVPAAWLSVCSPIGTGNPPDPGDDPSHNPKPQTSGLETARKKVAKSKATKLSGPTLFVIR